MTDLPNINPACFDTIDPARLLPARRSTHAPRILLLYGSLRERSFSRFAIEEAARLLTAFGAEPRIFDPRGLPMADAVEAGGAARLLGHAPARDRRDFEMF